MSITPSREVFFPGLGAGKELPLERALVLQDQHIYQKRALSNQAEPSLLPTQIKSVVFPLLLESEEFLEEDPGSADDAEGLSSYEIVLHTGNEEKSEIPNEESAPPKERYKPLFIPEVLEDLGTISYAYGESLPKRSGQVVGAQDVVQDLNGTTPYQILGIAEEEEDLAVIEKKYRKLAGYWHPDRNQALGDIGRSKFNVFYKITEAYQKIREKVAIIDPFSYDLNTEIADPVEQKKEVISKARDFYSKGEIYFKSLEAKLHSIQQMRNHKEPTAIFLRQLKEGVASGFLEGHPLKIKIIELIRNTESLLRFIEVRDLLFSMKLPSSSQPVEERKKTLYALLEQLPAIGDLVINRTWSELMLNYFEIAYCAFVDKYRAIQRAWGECEIQEEHGEKIQEILAVKRRYFEERLPAAKNDVFLGAERDKADFLSALEQAERRQAASPEPDFFNDLEEEESISKPVTPDCFPDPSEVSQEGILCIYHSRKENGDAFDLNDKAKIQANIAANLQVLQEWQL